MSTNASRPSEHRDLRDTLEYTETTDMLPVGDMTTVNALGDVQQPIVYDRFMFANQKSRLPGLGDYFRGDLAIVPYTSAPLGANGVGCAGNPHVMFRPSVHPHIDLNEGAMAVMGGVNNTTNKDLHLMMNQATAGVYHTMGGVYYSVQKNTTLGACMNDINLTAFP